MYSLLIRNALIAQADGTTFEGDLACLGSKIVRIDGIIDDGARETINAEGKLLMPGVIDPQVHFRDPGATHKEGLDSGSRAAVKGGVTSFLEMPNTNPATISQQELDKKLERAAMVSSANFGFFIGATTENLAAINSVAPVCGIKIFMGSSTGNLLVDKEKDLEHIFANGDRLIAVHAENEARIKARTEALLSKGGPVEHAIHSQIRDVQCAVEATQLALSLSNRYQRRLHILHLSTGAEVDILRQNKPAWVTAEVIPNHLFLNISDYQDKKSLVQMNPPIREISDNQKLWHGLKDGVIDIIATDHAPHLLSEKDQKYPLSPSGMPGVETSLPLMLTEMVAGRCTLKEILSWMCQGPAQTYRIKNKGVIAEDWDADLTIVDIDNFKKVRNEDMFTRVGWNPYQGRSLTGWSSHTIVGGQIAYAEGKIREGVFGKALEFDT
ncbi:dihydroorotase [Pseudomonadota bacterium]